MLARRQFLHLAATAAALPNVSRIAYAQTYPTRPVRLIVGFPAGGPTDIVARLIGQVLSERFGHPFIIDNRPGAGGNIGTEAAVRAPPDGHTLLLVVAPHTINSTFYERLSFDFVRDIVPVAGIMRVPNVMVVNPSVPAQSVPEFIAFAKANPGKLSFASAGIGTTHHVAGELFNMMTGVDMLHVPYRGSAPALTDLIGGQVQVMFDSMPSSIGYIKAATLRALAVTTAAGSEALPDVPTVGKFLPGYEASGWFGLGVPKGTSRDIVDRLNREINTGLTAPRLKAQLADLGGTALAGTPADFGRLIAEETEKWGKVIRVANIKAR